jgi:mono/diheme cytochrome c family protein
MYRVAFICLLVMLLVACRNSNDIMEPSVVVATATEQPATLEATVEVRSTVDMRYQWEVTVVMPTETRPATSGKWPTLVSTLPAGDPARGEELYNIAFGCAACHGDPAVEGSNVVGPWHGQIAAEGATRIAGYSSADYLYESILLPSAFIFTECPQGACTGPPSAMPANFGDRMTPQDMANVIAYMLGTTNFEGNVEVVYPEP